MYHIYTRDYIKRETKSYIFSSEGGRAIIDESSTIFSDNANFVELDNGLLVFGAKSGETEESTIPAFNGLVT